MMMKSEDQKKRESGKGTKEELEKEEKERRDLVGRSEQIILNILTVLPMSSDITNYFPLITQAFLQFLRLSQEHSLFFWLIFVFKFYMKKCTQPSHSVSETFIFTIALA